MFLFLKRVGIVNLVINLNFKTMGILFILLIYFLGFKKYYVRIKNISAANHEELAKVLKYEFGITMAETKAVLDNDSYELLAGTLLEASSTKKKVNGTGAKASLFTRFFWQKKKAKAAETAEPATEEKVKNANKESWVYLNQVQEMTKKRGKGVVLEFTSDEDAMEVDGLLDKAEAVADAPRDSEYLEKLTFFRQSVSWALKKHWGHSWMVIGGVFVTILILGFFSLDNQGDVRKVKEEIKVVKNWEEVDIENLERPTSKKYYNLDNAVDVKSNLMYEYYDHYTGSLTLVKSYKEDAEKATSRSKRKSALETAEKFERKADKWLKLYEKVAKMDFDDFQDYYIDVLKEELGRDRFDALFVWTLFFIFLFMTPLYVYASYQYGYMMTKFQEEAKFFEEIKNWGFGIAASIFGVGLAMQFFPDKTVTYYYSNGSSVTRKEYNEENTFVMLYKAAYIAIAVFVICCVSCFIMTFQTVLYLGSNKEFKAGCTKYLAKVKGLKK